MQKQKQVKKSQKHQKSAAKDWFKYINEDNLKCAIPVGPRFQAEVPEWSGPPHKKYPHSALSESDSLRWLGTTVWSTKDTSSEIEGDVVGKGRADSCNCYSPGSVMCVKRHITEKRAQLQKDLGPAFQKWKFDDMGEAVAKSWKQSEQQKFTQLVKKNPVSEDKSFIKPALECFPLKSIKMIVSYYFNVYLPRQMSLRTRSGCTIVDTDDEEEKEKETEKEKEKNLCSKGSRKRSQVDGVTLFSSKLVKTKYLTGRR